MLVEGLIGALLRDLVKKLLSERVQSRLKQAEASVVAGMEKKGMVPGQKPLHDCTRDAIFRLLRKAIPSGDVADAVRDYIAPQVIPVVLARLGESPTLTDIVSTTREVILENVRDLQV